VTGRLASRAVTGLVKRDNRRRQAPSHLLSKIQRSKKFRSRLSRSPVPLRVTECRDVESAATGIRKQTAPRTRTALSLCLFHRRIRDSAPRPSNRPLYAFPGVVAGRIAQPFRLCQPSNWLRLLWEESSTAP